MIITVNELEKCYTGDGVTTAAVQKVSVQFHPGQFTTIVGPSGSGKSTLLSLIGTLDVPSNGSISYGNINVSKLSKRELADFRYEHLGFVFQQYHLLPTLTAIENVMAPLFTRKVSFSKEERAKEILTLVGLENKLHALPSQLSGGEQQRVAVARALVNEPTWLLADEPTGNLDSNNSQKLFELLLHLNREKKCGIIFITHDVKLAEQAERIITMKDGKIVSDGGRRE